MNKTQYYLKFLQMLFFWAIHYATVPFTKLHEYATDKVNTIDELLYADPLTLQMQMKKAEKENQANGIIR